MKNDEKERIAQALSAMTGGPAGSESTVVAQPAMPTAPEKKSGERAYATSSLHLRQTTIPILLTCGVLLPAVGSLKWIAGASRWSAFSTALSIALLIGGALLLAVAAVNMLIVRNELKRRKS